jgi:hypothetical protein
MATWNFEVLLGCFANRTLLLGREPKSQRFFLFLEKVA